MTPHDLLANFEVLAEAPNGIQRLRELVLELAVRGKLVEQDAGDEPVYESLGRMLGQQKAPKRMVGPFVLPNSWAWVSGEEAFSFVTSGSRGWAQYYASEGPIFLRIGNLDYGTTALDLRDIQRVNPPTGAEGQRTATQPGDVLVSITGDTGMVGLVPEGFATAYINQHIALCRPAIAAWAPFLATVLLAPFAQDQFRAGERGIKKSLGLGDIKGLRLPIPPEAEQNRIMTRVDELMALLDRLEAKRQEREAARAAARDSALAALRDAPTPDDVEIEWLRVQEQFGELFATPEDVKPLRQTILHLAVRGQLLANVEWVGPEGARLGDYIDFQNGYAFKSEWYVGEGIALVRNANVGHGSLDWTDRACISSEQAAEFERFSLSEGDIVITLDRPIISTGIKVARIAQEDLPCLLLQRVAKPVLKHKDLTTDFLFLWFTSPEFVRAIDPGRSNGVPHISTKEISAIPFRIMSKVCQVACVKKAHELLQVCDRLMRISGVQQEMSGSLAAAAVHHLEI